MMRSCLVVDRAAGVVDLDEVRRRTSVERALAFGILRMEALAQEVGEEVVVAVGTVLELDEESGHFVVEMTRIQASWIRSRLCI